MKITERQIKDGIFDDDYAAIDHNHDSDYAAVGHDHDGDYLPMGGGALTGNLAINTTVSASYALQVNGYTNFLYPIRWFSGDAEIDAPVGTYNLLFKTYNGSDGLAERMRVTTNGRVAIGKTTDINNPLDVAGAINTDAAYKVDNSAGTEGQVLRSDGTNGAVFSAIQDGDLPSSIARDTELPAVTEGAGEASGGKNGDIYRNSVTGKISVKINGTWYELN